MSALLGVGLVAELTDKQLLDQFAERNGARAEAAFAALVRRHGSMVLRVCRGILRDEHAAQDAFQATFLVLARKGPSLWVRDSVGPWLHRVTRRVAIRARIAADRRAATERRVAEMASDRKAEANWTHDVGLVLDEEIDRLPALYRLPVILCDIEGWSYAEAAGHLGCTMGTLKSRLARARERLRGVLIRRGVVPAVGGAGAALAAPAAAAVPTALVATTTLVAVRYVATTAPAGETVLPPVAELTEGVLKMMRLNAMIRLGGFVAMSCCLTAGVGLFAARGSGKEPVPSPQDTLQASAVAVGGQQTTEPNEDRADEAAEKERRFDDAEALEKKLRDLELREKRLAEAEAREKRLKDIESLERRVRDVEIREKRLKEAEAREKRTPEAEAREKRLREIEAREKRLAEAEAKEKRFSEPEARERRLREGEAKEKRLSEPEAREKRLKEIESLERRLKDVELREKRLKEAEAKEKRFPEAEAREKRLKEIEAREKRLDEAEARERQLKEAESIERRLKDIEVREKRLKEAEEKRRNDNR
jgi:RNA polymerase sigma factor (sigma-70 family)